MAIIIFNTAVIILFFLYFQGNRVVTSFWTASLLAMLITSKSHKDWIFRDTNRREMTKTWINSAYLPKELKKSSKLFFKFLFLSLWTSSWTDKSPQEITEAESNFLIFYFICQFCDFSRFTSSWRQFFASRILKEEQVRNWGNFYKFVVYL